MSDHVATIEWSRDGASFAYESYPREHTWSFDSGQTVRASAAPDFLGKPDAVDPEEAFVAALSSCHMLTFLAFASKKRMTVNRYTDRAVGTLAKNADGRLAVTRVVLSPHVEFDGDAPSPEELESLHHRSHEACFIASSVRTEVLVEPS